MERRQHGLWQRPYSSDEDQPTASEALEEGYALGSINVRLSTVKSYAARAMQTCVLSVDIYARIAQVKGYRRAEARHLDEDRTVRRGRANKAYQ